MPTPRSGITPSVRWKVFARDGFRCRYCGAAGGDAVLVVDHIHPVAHGGRDYLSNLITACELCNQGKSAHTVPSFDDLEAIHTTARIAALWMQWQWDDLVKTDHRDKKPSRAALMAVVRNSVNHDAAVDLLRRVAGKYHDGYFGEWAWATPGEMNYGVNEVLMNYSEWMCGWETDETPEERDARFWEDVPY